MNTILTDDEIRSAITEALKLKPTGLEEIAARAVEAAVLAKLAQQGPVAWVVRAPGGFHDVGYDSLRLNAIPHGTNLYAHPAPQQADRQRVPDGWKLVPIEPTERMCKAAADAWLDCHSKMVLNKAGAAAKAAIAAAPEAPAQASAVDERAAFEAWYSSLRNNARTAGLTLLDAWQARAALAKKGGDA